MNTFLKILLCVVVAVIAVKLLPLTFAVGCLLAGALLILLALGAGFIGVAGLAVLLLAAVLSPIWLPVLALLGIIALIKRSNGRPAAT